MSERNHWPEVNSTLGRYAQQAAARHRVTVLGHMELVGVVDEGTRDACIEAYKGAGVLDAFSQSFPLQTTDKCYPSSESIMRLNPDLPKPATEGSMYVRPTQVLAPLKGIV
ncbi:MAG TPA: hypothetical protein VMY99_04780 [Nevskiaceae bacterium]|nr:hypothetical protein [Nevskiaceae bacterium]